MDNQYGPAVAFPPLPSPTRAAGGARSGGPPGLAATHRAVGTACLQMTLTSACAARPGRFAGVIACNFRPTLRPSARVRPR